MPVSRTRRQLSTNLAGLRQATAPYVRPTTETFDAPESGYFPLQHTRYPPGTPVTAVRSRKMYSDLVDERAYLLKLREFWINKLKDLEEDHKYLSKMKDISKNEVIGIQPLFARKEDEPLQLQHPSLSTATANASPQEVEESNDIRVEESTSEDFKILGNDIGLENLDELEAMFKSKYSDDEEIEDKENDEDEEKTREALSRLLQEFGDTM